MIIQHVLFFLAERANEKVDTQHNKFKSVYIDAIQKQSTNRNIRLCIHSTLKYSLVKARIVCVRYRL